VVNEETIGVLLGGLSNCGFAEVHGRGEPADVTGVADLQAIHRLRRVRYFIRDPEIVI
jgi:hypothetical protein